MKPWQVQSGRITKAENLMHMLRRMLFYGIMAELQGCTQVHDILKQAQFTAAPRRRTVWHFLYVQVVINMAAESNRKSVAFGTALQFETGMRQKHVFGEWEPFANREIAGGIIVNDRTKL
jgi:hypothetical protein